MNLLKNFFFFLSPVIKWRIEGTSMYPTFEKGNVVLAVKTSFLVKKLKRKDIIILKHPKNRRFLIKRISDIRNDMVFVIGDNNQESTDSRHFGWIDKTLIVGKVIYTL